MRTLTKTGIRILSAKYRSILIKCAIINASVFIGVFGASPSFADDVYVSSWMGLQGAVAGDANPIYVNGDITRGASDEDITISRTLSIVGSGTDKYLRGNDTYHGLVVEDSGVLTFQNITMTNFTGGAGDVGAIANYGTLYLKATDSDIKFEGNSVPNDFGGAIFNGYQCTVDLYADTGKSITFIGNAAQNGGAIYNGGNITTIASNFSTNSATNNGGAVYNENTINFVADNRDITFSGNYVTSENGLGGAIYNSNNSTVGLYADEGYEISFVGGSNDTANSKYDIDGIYNLGNLNINGDGTVTPYKGTVNLYNVDGTGITNIYGGTVNALADITQSATNVNNATLKLGIVGTGEDARAVNVSNLNLTNHATLDAYNGHIDTTEIKSINSTATNPVNVKFDVDLANKTGDYNNSDKFNITTFVEGSKLLFNDVNFISDMDSAYGKIKLADKNIGTIEKIVNSNVADSKYKYLFKASNLDGSIDILRALKVGLREYVHNNVSDEFPSDRTYTMNEAEYIIETLGGFGTDATSLTVDGTSNQYDIIGNGFGGITVGNEKTLTIKDVGELNPNGSIKSSINGFMKSGGYGGFIIAQNGGIVNIENSVISSNTVSGNNAYGGAIFNMGNATGLLKITDSAFIDNQAVKDDSNGNGGAIYNYSNSTTNILAKDKDVIFRGNTSGDGTSGAIYNAGTLGLYAKEGKKITFEGKKDGVDSSTADTIFNSGTININGNFESNDYTGEVNLVGVTGETGTTNIYGGIVNANGNFVQNELNIDNAEMKVNGVLDVSLIYLNNSAILGFGEKGGEQKINSFSELGLGNSTVNLQNNSIETLEVSRIELYGENQLLIDADLAKSEMDQLKVTSASDGGNIVISDIRLLSDANDNYTELSLFADGTTQDLFGKVSAGNLNGLKYSPIYKYDALYDQTTGKIGFTRTEQLNPYIYAPSVVANTTAAMTTQIATLAMDKMDDVVHAQGRSGGDTTKSSNAWVKVMGLNDNVEFNNFENVDSKALTVVGGYNTDKITWADNSVVFGAYAGYIGGKQHYTANDIDQDGGYVGLSSALTLGDAFLTATVNGGLLKNKANNMYGSDRFNTLWLGTGLKAGYNYAITDSVVLQPNVYGGYTLVNTQDYTSVSGVKIATNNLNFFEVDPGLKLSAVIADGWTGSVQGKYAIVMDNGADITANDFALQNISTKNYFEYGIGIDKSVTDAFYLGAKINRHDGGRTGWNGSIEFRYKF